MGYLVTDNPDINCRSNLLESHPQGWDYPFRSSIDWSGDDGSYWSIYPDPNHANPKNTCLVQFAFGSE